MTHAQLEPIHHDRWAKEPALRHGFFTRPGGVSTGIYAGLNAGIGSRDERAAVIENRNRIASHLGIDHEALVTVHQVHSPDVVTITGPVALDDRPKADAMVTNKPGLALAILTADCGPILLADSTAGVIGAAHAGWKGALGGIVENTVSAMEKLGAQRDRIEAILGPTISQENYEVGPEFRDRLEEADPANADFLIPSQKPDHFMFDLPAYIIAQARETGIQCIWTGHCTYGEEHNFFSYRRTTHRGEGDYGRGLSAIVLEQ